MGKRRRQRVDTRYRTLTASATRIHQKQQNLRTCRPMYMPKDPVRFYIEQTKDLDNRHAHQNHNWI